MRRQTENGASAVGAATLLPFCPPGIFIDAVLPAVVDISRLRGDRAEADVRPGVRGRKCGRAAAAPRAHDSCEPAAAMGAKQARGE